MILNVIIGYTCSHPNSEDCFFENFCYVSLKPPAEEIKNLFRKNESIHWYETDNNNRVPHRYWSMLREERLQIDTDEIYAVDDGRFDFRLTCNVDFDDEDLIHSQEINIEELLTKEIVIF